ncbi:MAG: hypothetical protein R3F61_29190 [Myxococcota bacterium]
MERSPLISAFVVYAALTVVAVGIAVAVLDPLPPTTSLLYVVPPLLGGLYLIVSATFIRDLGAYGAIAGRLPPAGHGVLQGVGFALTGLGVWMLLSQPPAGAGLVSRTLPALDGWCTGSAGVRLDRDVLPTVEQLLELRDAQSRALQSEIDGAVAGLMTRCAGQAREAFADPRGTHASWRRLRDWLSEHPDLHGLSADDPLFASAWREREPEPRRGPSVPVPVLLER